MDLSKFWAMVDSTFTMKPRWYQIEAVEAIFNYFVQGGKGNPLVLAPTGTGKSLKIALFVRAALYYFGDQKILVCTHKKELIEQNSAKLREIWPDGRIGINSASLGRRDTLQPVIFCAIDSVMNDADRFNRIDIILIDEAHLVDEKIGSRYMRFIAAVLARNPRCKIIGLTATGWRTASGMLTNGAIFTDVCYDICGVDMFNRLIDEGYLAPLICRKTGLALDVSGVHTEAGDYKLKELDEAVNIEAITREALAETLQAANDPEDYRHCWLVFGSTIDHCENIKRILEEMGVPTTIVHSKLKKIKGQKDPRDQNIIDFKAGKYRAIVSQGVLTTGFDHPPIDLLVMLRPTQSSNLWVQMLGRGTRPYRGWLKAFLNIKLNCLVLDFARNRVRLGPINDPLIPSPRGKVKGAQPPPVKECPECMVYCYASAKMCGRIDPTTGDVIEGCGHIFEFAVKIDSVASEHELIKRDKPVETIYAVNAVTYGEHISKTNQQRSVKVTYVCGARYFSEWICPEHDGPVVHKAREWWRIRTGGKEMPRSVDVCLHMSEELRSPTHVKVVTSEKFPRVIAHDFTGTAFGQQFDASTPAAPPAPAGNIALALSGAPVPPKVFKSALDLGRPLTAAADPGWEGVPF